MDFAPDYGLKLKSLGHPDDHEFVLMPFQMMSLSIDPVDGLFTTTANTNLDGEEYALTLEFGPESFQQMFRLLPFQFAVRTLEILADNPKRPFCLEFPFPVPMMIRARFGEVQTNEDESYLPLQVISADACPGEPKNWLTYGEVDDS